MQTAPGTVTRLLIDWSKGNERALDELSALVYSELKRLAHRQLRRERDAGLLETRALVSEAFLRLLKARQIEWQNRAQFFGIAATLMRRVLVENARAQQAGKRFDDDSRVELNEADASRSQSSDVVALNDALTSLAKIDERKSRIVELRYFAGLSVEEVAEVMSISTVTVKREWRWSKAWLFQELNNRS